MEVFDMVKTRMLQYYLISLGILTLGFFFLTACGSSKSLSVGSGTVGILLKDTHTVDVKDPSNDTSLTATQMWITIDKISLISEEDTFLSVYDSTALDPNTGQPAGPKTYDLLSLHSTADLVTLASLPAGTYKKVRFELQTEGGSNYFCTGTGVEPCASPFRYDLTVPAGKVDVELKPALVVSDGSLTNVVFDFVPDKSIQIIATGGPDKKYLLRPEIHVGLLGTGSLGDFHLDEIELEEFKGGVETTQCDLTPPTLTLRHRWGQGLIEIDLSQALIPDAEGFRLACEDLTTNLIVEVKGTLRSDGTLLAGMVKVQDHEL
jgi:hypothetical protein